MTVNKVTSLADIVYEQVERDILGGVYHRGDILTELRLSDQLKVSRTPVREALRRLEQDDLVESRGKSIVVVGITPEDLMDILEMRARLEGLATAKCCRRITKQELAELDEIITLQEFYVSRGMTDKVLESDGRFHETIFAACGSRTYEKQLNAMHKKLQRYRKMSVSVNTRAIASAAEHRDIFQALTEGNAELAEQLAVRHVEMARENILNTAQADAE